MKSIPCLTAYLSLVLAASSSYASPISFTESVLGSGSLNGVAFSDQLITLSGTGDTSNATVGSPDTLTLSSAAVQVGGSTSSFTDTIDVFSESGLVGFAVYSGDDILDTASGRFEGYDLTTAVSGTVANSIINSGVGFATTGGTFVIQSTSGDDTFTATTGLAPTPEPSALVMLATGFAGVLGIARRRLRGRNAA